MFERGDQIMKGYAIGELTGENARNEFEWIALFLADALLTDDGTVFDRFGDIISDRECSGL